MNKLNIIEYCDRELKSNKDRVIKELNYIRDNMLGRPCYSPKLNTGKSSSFLIFLLKEFFDYSDKTFDSYLEIGCLYGGSLCALAHSGFDGVAYGCDIFEGYYGKFNDPDYPADSDKNSKGHMKIVDDNVKKFSELIEINLIKGDSLDENFKIDTEIKDLCVLYIDGLHTEKGCSSDWRLYNKFVKKGGLILVDNFEMIGVRDSINKVIKPSGLVEELGVWNNSTWIAIKK